MFESTVGFRGYRNPLTRMGILPRGPWGYLNIVPVDWLKERSGSARSDFV